MADKSALIAMIRPAVEAADMEFWGLEMTVSSRSALLRVYIEHENGVTVDDCARVSHQISGVLDVEDPITLDYRLEVSSPGWDRPLFTEAQYQRFVGSKLKIKTILPVAGRRNFTGHLNAVTDGKLNIGLTPEDHVELALDQIDKAHVVPDIEAELSKKR